jgi:peptide/nickel transport system permease protein
MALEATSSFGRNSGATLSLAHVAVAILAVVTLVAILAPYLPMPGYTTMSAARLAPPSFGHWFGTDQFGRDIFARVVYGVRTSLWVSLIGVATSALIGVPLGLLSGYSGGAIDGVIMRALDALLAFPSLLLAIGISAVLGPGAVSAALALGIVGVPQMARIVRGSTMVERSSQYIDAARTIGASGGAIMLRHILPNVAAPIAVQAALFFAVAVLTEASLSFLGLGVQVPMPSLGSMLYEARQFLKVAPWYALAPGLTITLLVLIMNLFADALRDRLDPGR